MAKLPPDDPRVTKIPDPNSKRSIKRRKDGERQLREIKVKPTRDKEIVSAQATIMLAKRLVGVSVNAIAEEHGVSVFTVQKRVELAKREHKLFDATNKVLEELVTLAHDTYKTALQSGDVNAARDIMFGTGILSKNNKAQVAPEKEATPEMTLEVWRDQRKIGHTIEIEAIPSATEGEIEAQDEPND